MSIPIRHRAEAIRARLVGDGFVRIYQDDLTVWHQTRFQWSRFGMVDTSVVMIRSDGPFDRWHVSQGLRTAHRAVRSARLTRRFRMREVAVIFLTEAESPEAVVAVSKTRPGTRLHVPALVHGVRSEVVLPRRAGYLDNPGQVAFNAVVRRLAHWIG
ncbi:MAG: hypothetical protein AAGD18_22500 [Actinomycetota bacterium]